MTVFTTAACTHCRRAKAALASADVNYVEVDVGEDLELLARLKAFTGRGTVPQVICTCTFHAVPRSAAEFLGGGRVFVQSNIQVGHSSATAWQPGSLAAVGWSVPRMRAPPQAERRRLKRDTRAPL